MGVMTENEIIFSVEITFYVLQIECSVMLATVWEAGLFVHFFVVYCTWITVFISITAISLQMYFRITSLPI